MCEQPPLPQDCGLSSASTLISSDDDDASTSDATDISSRTSIFTQLHSTEAIPLSPLSTRRRKSFLPRTPARRQSAHDAEGYRKQKLAERDRRISERDARGRGYKALMEYKEDTLNLQHLLFTKLAAMENGRALGAPSRGPGASEGELRRQRKDHVDALVMSAKFPC